MINLESEIKSILNLRTNEYIGQELANRQLAVITKGYQYLSNPDNNILYIADEVGLGKTFIAAGIALLFRHFSIHPEKHIDIIIVPKKNLQDKWKKELGNFVSKNYLLDNEILKNSYTFEQCIKDKIRPLNNNEPLTIFRMTSFSSIVMASNARKDLKKHFINEVFNKDKWAEVILNKAYDLGYFHKDGFRNLRNLIAYLMNALSPKINCLIIDEAHNYKYGPGDETREESIRNEATARFLGAIKDIRIFSDFPELKEKVKFPLAQKVICLSATPKDRNLYEIKNQMSCFTEKHVLSRAKTNADIEFLLKKFLIRGNLEYILKKETVSRNQCREEHRQGNVNKSEIPEPLIVDDNFESVFWQLIQYKSIRHLNQKNNASFEIGMLAGFETYNVDLDRKNQEHKHSENEDENFSDFQKEYEHTEHRKIKESQDINIVRGIISSYNETFNQFPPHPKQSKLENEVINQLKHQDKSLLFVRRIASSVELEKRILEKYEREIVINLHLELSRKYINPESGVIDKLIDAYNTRKIKERLNDIIKILLTKNEIKNCLFAFDFINDKNYNELGLLWLTIAFNSETCASFKKSIEYYIIKNSKNISLEFKNNSIDAIQNSYDEFINQTDHSEENDTIEDNEHSGYFFLDYFKKGSQGFPYRTKMYRENWFEINPIALNNHFNFSQYDVEDLNSNYLKNIIPVKKKSQNLTTERDIVYNYLITDGFFEKNTKPFKNMLEFGELRNSTFLTRLLFEYCATELNGWLEKRPKNNKEEFIKDLKILNTILRNTFRNGSGLLAGYLADQNPSFEDSLLKLITSENSPFHFILKEVKTMINDYDLIIATNFDKKDEKKIESILRNLVPVIGTSGQDKRNRGIIAAQFRMPGMPYVLITTDIFREGEDLHTYCQNIYHYGIAWNPSDMEQRTGRIDRINSLSYRKLNKTQELEFNNKIQVFYPYLKQSVEVNQVVQLFLNLNKFIETFNTINIESKYESKVSISLEIENHQIPQPIKERLKSIYDVGDFVTN